MTYEVWRKLFWIASSEEGATRAWLEARADLVESLSLQQEVAKNYRSIASKQEELITDLGEALAENHPDHLSEDCPHCKLIRESTHMENW